ncbi:5'-AMP-activated protein kinase beta subunit, interation domain-containing protein [Collybia nuda]|uniref:5'-AMP-activated protein kinase beta subunit, interation domain-containing protein n=1 Tax=Collybia nuda TaxID=64659 RepID=A0A9P5YCE0_9AGAR|nr:5'-AMP-activated protein kinase beta subunit, interation domain-containing protein [Collybia nuda]
MGNATSNANPQRNSTLSPRHSRPNSSSPSTSPQPGLPHPSLRRKKGSLELPDLASLSITNSRGRQHPTPPKSASIPIPIGPPNLAIPGEAGRTRPPPTVPSGDVLLTEPSTHIPFPPPPRGRPNSYFRGTPRPPNSRQQSHARQQQQAAHIQELYNQYNQAQAPPPSPTIDTPQFVPEIVHSSIPIALGKALLAQLDDAGIPVPEPLREVAGPPELVPVRITWRGGGKTVMLARAGDDDWQGRQLMQPDEHDPNVFHASVRLPPGTHHIRFLVDDQWRVAIDLPAAVDDQGSLANYVAVPISYSPPAPTAGALPASPPQQLPVQKRNPGQSFWSAASSTDDESVDQPHGPGPSQTPQQPQHSQQRHHHHHHQPAWTSVFPPELIEAAREEEAYLSASSGQLDRAGGSSGTTYVSGFVPAPNIPPAPGLPRHLDKLILNSRVVTGGAGGGTTGSASGSVNGKGGNGKGGGSGKHGAMAANSVGGRSKGREREKKEREREERRREKRGAPPAPPPSEDGTGVEVVVTEVDPVSPTSSPSLSLSPSASTTPTPSSTAATTPCSTTPTHATTTTGEVVAPVPVPATPGAAHNGNARPLTQPLGLETSSNTPMTDDGSVLPVPSHVVLHHLSTSAIRNGVLAVGNTTRYRKKYLTTIYYKPTEV